MKFATAAATAALVAGVSATYGNGTQYTTEVVDVYTTYCPAATTLTHGSQTITVTEATTVTFDCPCTISKPIYSASVVQCSTCSASPSAPAASAPAASAPSAPAPAAPYPTGNATVPAAPSAPSAPAGETPGASVPAGSASASAPISTGAASKSFAPAGLAGLLGLAAYLL